MRLQTVISTVLGTVLLAGALVYAFQAPAKQPPLAKPQKTLIKVQEANETFAARTAIFSAVTRPKHHAVLSFTVPARMTT